MYVQQLYTTCLSEAAYYIESNGEAAVIDPLRDTDEYIQLAQSRGATIKYIFETHFHADFVSGHIDLSRKVGAPIVYGPTADTHYQVQNAADGEVFALGECSITALHTPGHTLESTCWLLKDKDQRDYAIFTGDTLFVGDVGRPDLFGATITKEELAAMMYDSLNTKIKPLHDDVIVYPAHGAGSSCGKNLGKETHTTIGIQRAANYALLAENKEEFVAAITEGLNTPPQYFSLNAKINKEGYDSLDLVLEQGMTAMNLAEFKAAMTDDNTIVLDTRHATVFTQGYVPTSVFVGLEGRFAEWVGSVLPITKALLLVTDEGKERETIVRLARIGYDNVLGYLQGGFDTWKNGGEEMDMIIDVEPDELVMDLKYDNKAIVLDVRKMGEYDVAHLRGARLSPLNDFMEDPMIYASLEEDENVYVHCAGGYRSVIAASLMKREDMHNVRNVLGGWNAIKEVPGADIVSTIAQAN
jgi:hydroxyacylglutathione hydrolase